MRHPERGLIPPDAFIPYIEKTFMISKVTEWVIKTAFLEVKNMEKENIDVNFSVNIPLHKLELEILERDNVDNFKKTDSAMRSLKEMGIDFSLDDYGTGYSTLSYMQQLPFVKINIDKKI